MTNAEVPRDILERGILILHARIRMMEWVFYVSERLKCLEPKWRVSFNYSIFPFAHLFIYSFII